MGRKTKQNKITSPELIAQIKEQGRPDIPHYRCKCACGNIITVSAHSLRYGNTKSCGCFHNERAKATKHHKDLSGGVFGKLAVIEKDPEWSGPRQGVKFCVSENRQSQGWR